jgi:hypothetical protein
MRKPQWMRPNHPIVGRFGFCVGVDAMGMGRVKVIVQEYLNRK